MPGDGIPVARFAGKKQIQRLKGLCQPVDKGLSTGRSCKSAVAYLQRKGNGKTSFLARPTGTLQMIAEATCCCSSRRTCRRCGFHMKGLRPLHASPELFAEFVDALTEAERPLFCFLHGSPDETDKKRPGNCSSRAAYGGGEENRTPVRKSDCQAFSERSLRFHIPSPGRPQTGSGVQ